MGRGKRMSKYFRITNWRIGKLVIASLGALLAVAGTAYAASNIYSS